MRLLVTILLIIFSIKSFSQEKENNGTIYKNGPYVEAVRNLMNVYKTNSIKKICPGPKANKTKDVFINLI